MSEKGQEATSLDNLSVRATEGGEAERLSHPLPNQHAVAFRFALPSSSLSAVDMSWLRHSSRSRAALSDAAS